MDVTMPVQSRLHQRFCEAVRSRRTELGLTQVEVAERMGVTQPYYAAIERGRNSPTIDVIDRVSQALECDPAMFFTLERISA